VLLFETWKLILVTMVVAVIVDGDITTTCDGYESSAPTLPCISSLDPLPRTINAYSCWYMLGSVSNSLSAVRTDCSAVPWKEHQLIKKELQSITSDFKNENLIKMFPTHAFNL